MKCFNYVTSQKVVGFNLSACENVSNRWKITVSLRLALRRIIFNHTEMTCSVINMKQCRYWTAGWQKHSITPPFMLWYAIFIQIKMPILPAQEVKYTVIKSLHTIYLKVWNFRNFLQVFLCNQDLDLNKSQS